jgi:hypothetical protein
MVTKLYTLIILLICPVLLVGQIAGINMKNYYAIAETSFNNRECSNVFSIPIIEWNESAFKYTCNSGLKLEELLNFTDNPNFQLIVLFDNNLKLIESKVLLHTSRLDSLRKQDSINWTKEIPNIPYSNFLNNPINKYNDVISAYKYHIKYPEDFIFMIAYIEGIWVIKRDVFYVLKKSKLQDANSEFCLYIDDYIRDIADGVFNDMWIGNVNGCCKK